jgi:hypothetical protein
MIGQSAVRGVPRNEPRILWYTFTPPFSTFLASTLSDYIVICLVVLLDDLVTTVHQSAPARRERLCCCPRQSVEQGHAACPALPTVSAIRRAVKEVASH